MSYSLIVITLVLLIWFWTWIINQVFSSFKEVKLRKILLWGGILVAALAIYERIFYFLGIDKSSFYIREVFNIPSVVSFIVYGIIVLLGISLIFHNGRNKKILLEIGIVILSLIILAFGGFTGGLTALVCYYFLATFTEESFKFTVSNNQEENIREKKISTLLLISLLMGMSFSFSENLLALIIQLINGSGITANFLFGRGLIASLIHCVSTGMIALLLMRIRKGNLVLRYFIALLGGFSIHIAYNLSLIYGLSWLVILLGIGAFVGLTYLIFHIDEIYME